MTPNGDEATVQVKPSSIATRTSLVAGLKAISQDRWLEFVQVYSPLIRTWVRQDGVPDAALDDVVQECLVSFFRSIGSFERRSSKKFRGWLRTIVKRRVADAFRESTKDRVRTVEGLSAFPQRAGAEHDPADESPESQCAHREAALRACEIVKQAVAAKTWAMFWQSVVEQRPGADIAREFGVAVDHVRVARHRVLNRLKDLAIEERDLGM